MSTVITAAGETLIAQKHISGEALVIDRIILANIPGLDVSLPVDPEQGKPSANKIVYDYVIPQDYKGFVNPNQVVYSMLLGSEVGNFQFNWLGLFSSAENALVAVTHLPVTEKWQTDKGSNTLGNNLTRNFLLQFSGAKAVTNITVEAKTWQVDFTARLRSIDDRERLSNRDIYGRSCFFNDGFNLVKESGKYKLKAGVGYVDGLNCVLASDLQVAVSALPKNVFIDVSLQQQGSNVLPVIAPKIGSNWEDYTDGNNVRHYCIKVAEISAAGVINDVRRAEGVTSDLVEYLKRRTDTHANRKDDPHNTLAKVRALFSSSTTNASSSSIATPLAIKTVNDSLSTHKSANDPHGVVAKVKALLTSSITSSSTTTFATPRAVKTVNDSLNAHKSSNDPHGVVAKVKALLSNATTSSSTTTFATPKAVKTVNDSLNVHKAGNDPHGVVAKVRALLTSSVTSTSTTMFATPRAVKTVYDHLNTHKAASDPHSVVAKVRALLTSSVTSTSTTLFATPRAVKTAHDKGISAYNLANTKVNKVNMVVFTSSGTYRKSPNLIAAEVIVTGGGASGGKLYYNGAGGGGGAGTSIKTYSAAEIPSSVSVVVGAGGIGNADNGHNGGNSKFLNQIGGGGMQSHLYHSGGAGGTGAGGDINLRGSGGSVGDHEAAGGAGGASYWGGGALGSMDESLDYLHGSNGGGGGGRDEMAVQSGNGGKGLIVIKEFLKG
ncbi:phage tail protein [Halodesulfovibrio sp. MK-HDV]|uniref:phage tail protein n=1 Tax=Halodesulfovibrio sp. MK-HDV TaxID=2599925 RepID=UPI00136EE43E|nr:phage tail protein [Halodesulfovibrio sp. MK-HDV]KAF1073596.1 hypothetical protein MKHDV_03438 [Halodesulfovibrio sp. MK-HDV]